MTIRQTRRKMLAVGLVVVVALIQLSASFAIVAKAYRDYPSPTMPWWSTPFLHNVEVFRGEIIFSMSNAWGTVFDRVHAFNLRSGRIREISLPDLFPNPGFVADGDRFWAMGNKEVIEFDGTSVIRHKTNRALRALGHWAVTKPFIHDGPPALICRNDEGALRLQVFDEEWRDKGEIIVPGNNLHWVFDKQSGQSEIAHRATLPATDLPRTMVSLQVIPVRGQNHVVAFLSEMPTRNASDVKVTAILHCARLDVVDDNFSAASALSPVHADADSSNWTTLKLDPGSHFKPGWTRSFAIGDKLYLCNDTEILLLSDTGDSSSFATEKIVQSTEAGELGFLVNSSFGGNEVYFLKLTEHRDVAIFQFDGHQLKELPQLIDGPRAQEKRWLVQIVLEILLISWICSFVIAVVTACFIEPACYEFGTETVMLAPIGRRMFARLMDSVLLLSPLATWAVLQATSPAIRILVDFDVMSDLLVFGIVWLIALWTVMTIGLGVWGLTPGKWLFGVRVVRSTLRPCGIPRAALRELLIWLDAPQLLVVAPGAICLLLTQNRQRVGDLAADTLVVDC